MRGVGFETATRRNHAPQSTLAGVLGRYRPQIVVSTLVVIVLVGGALYAARISEVSPQVVYSASLEEVETQTRDTLVVNINTADAAELDELPGVGPATAEAILEHRRANGLFRSVEDLEAVPGIGPATVEEMLPFARV